MKFQLLPCCSLLKVATNLSAKDPSKAGIASLTAAMLNEDSEKYTAEEISNQLEKLGSSISVSSGAPTNVPFRYNRW